MTSTMGGIEVAAIEAVSGPDGLTAALLDACADAYTRGFPDGKLQVFTYGGVEFLFDADPRYDRTVAALGKANVPLVARDSTYQRGYPLAEKLDGRRVDRGHFIPYSAGGDFGPNIYMQDRALNRGWSREGRRYRELERRAVAAGTDALMLAFPIYTDDSAIPAFVQLVVATSEGVECEVFRNRFNVGIDDLDPMLVLLSGATDAQIGALGEETVAVLLEESGATLVALGDAGLPRTEGRQDLDIVAIANGSLVVFEVKTRHGARHAGTLTREGNLRRPRLKRSPAAHRQGSQPYVAERIAGIVDTGPGFDGVDVQVVVVDLVAMLAQSFDLDAAGTRLNPIGPPSPCDEAARVALKRILDHRGFL